MYIIINVHLNNGYGTKALELCIDYIKTKPFGNSNDIILTCNIQNHNAIYIYTKLGFVKNGECDDEIVMKLVINN